MIAQTNAVISAKSTYAAGARIQKSRATKVRDDATRIDSIVGYAGQRYAGVDDDDVRWSVAECVLTVVCVRRIRCRLRSVTLRCARTGPSARPRTWYVCNDSIARARDRWRRAGRALVVVLIVVVIVRVCVCV
jgi:hypothetical protein